MAIAFSETDWEELCIAAQLHGEKLYRQTMAGTWHNLPQQFGRGGEQTILLRDGLVLNVREGELQEDLALKRHHESTFPLVSKFFLSGRSRVCTANIPSVADDYEEVAGCHYLYCLPELVEIEKWQAKEPIQVVMVYADLDYFKQFEPDRSILPDSLRHLIEADSIEPFHHSLGRMTPVILQVLQQIINCPYQGLMQQLYLEGKALELLTLQLTRWIEPQWATAPSICLQPDDVERLHCARKILIQRASNPPGLIELARQVGLNDRKLKQGFLHLFGTTVFGYLHDYRLERSQEILASGEMSVTEVARTVGYASLPSFSKAFSKKFGSSPTAYALGQNSKKVRLG
jgi:AraC-like DNA-binding protein